MKGRKPEPAEVKEIKGNPGKRKTAATPDTVAIISNNAPDYLQDDKLALGIWAHLSELLSKIRFVKETDRHALGRYCAYMAIWIRMKKKVRKTGEFYETDTNHGKMQRIHPAFAIMMRSEDKMIRLEDRLGLTSMSRQQLMMQMSSLGLDIPGLGLDNPNKNKPEGAEQGADLDSPIGMFAPRPPPEQMN